MAVSGNSVELALRNIRMQPGRLRVDVYQLVILACDDDDWHLQTCIMVAQLERVRDHQGRLRGGCTDLRRSQGHLLWKGGKFFWHGSGTKDFRHHQGPNRAADHW